MQINPLFNILQITGGDNPEDVFYCMEDAKGKGIQLANKPLPPDASPENKDCDYRYLSEQQLQEIAYPNHYIKIIYTWLARDIFELEDYLMEIAVHSDVLTFTFQADTAEGFTFLALIEILSVMLHHDGHRYFEGLERVDKNGFVYRFATDPDEHTFEIRTGLIKSSAWDSTSRLKVWRFPPADMFL